MKFFYFFSGFLVVVAVVGYFYGQDLMKMAGKREVTQTAARPQVETTPVESKEFVAEAHQLGTRLFAAGKQASLATRDVEAQQIRLAPVHADVEGFISRSMSGYGERVTSIVVVYRAPDIECSIYVKDGSEEELAQIKRTAERCIGRIVENLPIVKYLMVKHDGLLVSTLQPAL